jgi:phosphoribosylformylglycinamidine synthase
MTATATGVRALVLTGEGLNCEMETQAAFECVGATVERIHLHDLIAQPSRLLEFHILAFIGGFSFGDHLGAGTVFANRVRHHLGGELNEFITSGRLVIGICNGMQTITRLGLAPAIAGAYFKPQAAMAANDSGAFYDGWVTLKVNPDSPCIFTRGIDMIPLPVRHGEGKFIPVDAEALEEMEANNQVVMRYVDPVTGQPASRPPLNPNGSINAVAAICDETGRIFGMMPHPEAYLSPYNHPHWTRQRISKVLPEEGLGVQIFRNAVTFAEAELL